MRRGRLLGLVTVAVVAAAVAGWWAGQSIASPAMIAAETAPPEPSLVTVAVERTELSADIVTRADIGYEEPVPLSLAGAVGGEPEALIATWVPEVGSEVAEGDPVIEVSGRPVLALQGDIPVYRDLRPGSTGIDVLQLETALARLGYLPGEPDETWDAATAAGVVALYSAAGSEANGPTASEEAALAAARERARAAAGGVAAAEDEIAVAAAGPGEVELLEAREAVTAADEDLALARMEAARAGIDAEGALLAAQRDRDRAARDYTLAVSRYESAQAGVHPDTGALPTAYELEQLRLAVEDASRALRQAELAVAAAEIDMDTEDVTLTRRLREAENAVTVAAARLADLESPPDTSDLDRRLADARAEQADAASALAELAASTGTWIPAGELVFLPRLPARVDTVSVPLGARVEGSFVTVTGSELAVRASVPAREAGLVGVGDEALIDDPAGGEPVTGTVVEIADRPGTAGAAPDRHFLLISVESLPEALVGTNVRVVIPVESTEGAVLAVPAAALFATADGSTRIQVEDGDGTTRFVTVRPGLAAEGLVEITPLDGTVAEGDRVVVGVEDAS